MKIEKYCEASGSNILISTPNWRIWYSYQTIIAFARGDCVYKLVSDSTHKLTQTTKKHSKAIVSVMPLIELGFEEFQLNLNRFLEENNL